MKNYYYVLFFTLLVAVLSCGERNKAESNNTISTDNGLLLQASWLLGEWRNISPEGNASEYWERKSETAFIGKSFFVVGADTVSAESIVLEQEGEKLFYIPTVKDQNDGQPVRFVLTSATPNTLVFENPKHDFPQTISYTLVTNDSLFAEISGTMEGRLHSIAFPMNRVK